METNAVPETRDGVDGWLINGQKTWNTGIHKANYDMIFARTSGDNGSALGITCFLVPSSAPGFEVEEFMWTFNMPTDHALISLKDVWGPAVCRAWDAASGLQYDHSLGNSDDLRQFKNHRSLVSPIDALGVCIALDLWRFGGCRCLGAGDEWLTCLR